MLNAGWEFGGTDRFEVVRRIGAGGMGVVYEAVDRDRGHRVALKNISISPAVLSVHRGDSVTWTNTTSTQHTITECTGGQSATSCPSGASTGSDHGKQKRGTRGLGPQANAEPGSAAGGGTSRASHGRGNRNAEVYVPGLVLKAGRLLPYELRGVPKRVPAVPFQRVIARYQRSARASLDRSPLPPSLQEYVRRYFTALSHP